MQAKTFETDEPYVFLSFAGDDQAIAEKVEAYLASVGMRVFFAPKSISVGDNWMASINRALQECQAMVLLFSPHSMPERKEVELEWSYFDLNQKPIYPLYLQNCQLHNRFIRIHYEDARGDLLPGALERLLKKLRRDFNLPEVKTGKDDKPDPLTEYRNARIAEWSEPRYELDHRFVNLTLTLDRPEDPQQRFQPVEAPPMKDLREVLEKAKEHPALVLIGTPGSGKSTLLRRLQLDHSQDRLREDDGWISFFIQLNEYRGEQPPREWLAKVWAERYPQMQPLETWLKKGRALLLLDALNEMQPGRGSSYPELIEEWKAFAQQAARAKNRLVFSCRSRDIGANRVGSKELPVPLVDVQPMTDVQVQEFLKAYVPKHEQEIWEKLDGSKQLSLFKTPYFMKLLCDQVEAAGELPKGLLDGSAGLFTGYVRMTLKRELDGVLFKAGALLTDMDHQIITGREWRDAFDLPERGLLIRKLRDLAFAMQENGTASDGAQVRIDYDEACRLLADEHAGDIINAGVALNVLDKVGGEVVFFHQLLQEYFAARRLKEKSNPALVHVEWAADKVAEPLAATIAKLADGDPLPPLDQTGWEETTLTAAPMAKDPAGFIRALMPENLPLAARCAASAEVSISPELKLEIQDALAARTKDMTADLRARIAAGEALGLIGDPRFKLCDGKHGKYLMPPLVKIPGGKYTIGDNKGEYERERPAGEVELKDFQIGQFPVTNAEYKLFIEAGGYEQEQWWDTAGALAWLREGGSEGQKESWRDQRKILQGWSEDDLRGMVKEKRATPEQVEDWLETRNWSDEEFEAWLGDTYPAGKFYRQPEYWDDARFNNPAQPVVGVTWFEARAYCVWLTVNSADDFRRVSSPRVSKGYFGGDQALPNGRATDTDTQSDDLIFRLPTEAEFEAAARGKKGRQFPYGKTFDSSKCNTFESHIRRTTPVGVFDNATPESAFDLSGNAYTWTLSIYDQDRFPYPYRSDEREDILATGVGRVLRGGAWRSSLLYARAVVRNVVHAATRYDYTGFRVVVSRPPSS